MNPQNRRKHTPQSNRVEPPHMVTSKAGQSEFMLREVP